MRQDGFHNLGAIERRLSNEERTSTFPFSLAPLFSGFCRLRSRKKLRGFLA
jgi:hypothetical protein